MPLSPLLKRKQTAIVPSPPEASARWVKKWIKLSITIEDPKGFFEEVSTPEVIASCCGLLAVHQEVLWSAAKGRDFEGSNWIITHLPSGRATGKVGCEADALKVATVLLGLEAYQETTQEAVVAKLPLWVVPWVRACRAAGKYVPPSMTK